MKIRINDFLLLILVVAIIIFATKCLVFLDNEISINVLYVLSVVILTVAVVVFLVVKKLGFPKDFGMHNSNKTQLFLLVVMIGFLSLIVSIFAEQIVQFVYGKLNLTSKGYSLPYNNFLLVATLLYCLIAVFLEEIVFRYILFRTSLVKNKKLLPFSFLFTSVVFALLHMSYVSIGAFILGMTSCYVYHYTKNIVFSFIIHFINNGLITIITIIVLLVSKESVVDYANDSMASFPLTAMAIMILMLIPLFLLMKLLKKKTMKGNVNLIINYQENEIIAKSKVSQKIVAVVLIGIIFTICTMGSVLFY